MCSWGIFSTPVVDGSPEEFSTENPEADQLHCLAGLNHRLPLNQNDDLIKRQLVHYLVYSRKVTKIQEVFFASFEVMDETLVNLHGKSTFDSTAKI